MLVRMRVALFGGSFNPPHIGHQLVALTVLETEPVDALWMIPCFRHPFEKALEPYADRLAMCRLAMEPLGPRAEVSEIEGELGGESRTLVTVRALKQAHTAVDFSLVIGADLEDEVKSWYGAEELMRLVSFIVVGRGGHSARHGLEMPAVSSTDVRRRLAADEPMGPLVSHRVLDYIRARNLYRGPLG